MSILLDLGCQRAQGFLFSRPLRPGGATALIASSRVVLHAAPIAAV